MLLELFRKRNVLPPMIRFICPDVPIIPDWRIFLLIYDAHMESCTIFLQNKFVIERPQQGWSRICVGGDPNSWGSSIMYRTISYLVQAARNYSVEGHEHWQGLASWDVECIPDSKSKRETTTRATDIPLEDLELLRDIQLVIVRPNLAFHETNPS